MGTASGFMLPGPLNAPQKPWLDLVGEVAATSRPDEDGPPEPLTFLLGAGASLSSGAPKTADILATCRRMRPGVFPSDEAVYEKFSTALTPIEREQIIAPLFRRTDPYVGYRCLVSMARSRPVFVVNLNWDSYASCAGERIGVPVSSFDLQDVEEGRRYIDEARERGNGVVCAHVHGYLKHGEDHVGSGESRGIRFSQPDTLSFGAEELRLLQEMLAPFTIVAGTSLIGPRDAQELLRALLPPAGGEETTVRPLWVFERGPLSYAPGFDSMIALGLSNALLARHSIHNFISNPDIDFDTMLVALRAHEAELPWPESVKTETGLPPLNTLLPPNPEKIKSLLDQKRSLIVGVPKIGTSTVAYRLAWWHCLVGADRRPGGHRVRGFQGPGQALAYLEKEARLGDYVGAIVIDDLFDERDLGGDTKKVHARLAQALEKFDDLRVIATARPDAAVAACQAPSLASAAASKEAVRSLHGVFGTTVVCGRSLWRGDDLRAWARAGGGERAQIVCREVRMGVVLTPSQAVRTLEGRGLHEWEDDWATPLRRHLDVVYDTKNPHALLLAILRLQDFSIPRSEEELVCLADRFSLDRMTSADEVIDDPWGLCATIEVDGERYVRLSHHGVIRVVDDWIDADAEELEKRLAEAGEQGQWALEALRHWRVYRNTDPDRELPADFDRSELELFGTEYLTRALQQRRPKLAMDVLRRTWGTKRDHWVAKDVALDLVLHWDELGDLKEARDLRDLLLKAKRELGAYALFEAILRVGRPVAIDLWSPVVSHILDLAAKTSKDQFARHQVALCFDALMWRPCPVGHEQERSLLRKLEAAVQQDKLLRAAVGAAASYHLDGAKRLREMGFEVEALGGVDVSRAEAKEIQWIVAWHFVHQSRCRAVASRRTFLSTVEDAHAEAPRYLDRTVRQDALDKEYELTVTRLVGALLRYPETAGWALHLIMNLHTTTGMFKVPEDQIARLDDLLTSRDPDEGVISAAITYHPSDQIYELVLKILKPDKSRKNMLAGLGEGVDVEGTWVAEPRFSLGSNPWAIRDRWRATPKVPFNVSPQELIERLAAHVDEAVDNQLVERDIAEGVLRQMRRGQLGAAEVFKQRESKTGENGNDYVQLLVYVCDHSASRPADAG